MRFTATTATLRKVVGILDRLKKDHINVGDFRINTQGLDIGDVLLSCAEAMEEDEEQSEAAKEGMRKEARERSQVKPLKK